MTATPDRAPAAAWPTAARLIARWLDQRERIDALLDSLPRTLPAAERARCQHLVLGVVRHFGRIEAALTRLVSHPPRFSTRAVLFVTGYELIEAANAKNASADAGLVAKIVHHAVEQTKALASPAEARLVNAVVRKLAPLMAEPPPAFAAASKGLPPANVEEVAVYFSHPDWLVRSWLAQFGPDSTRALLEWNQQPAPVYARWRAENGKSSTPASDAPAAGEISPPHAAMPPAFMKLTQWPGFFEVPSGHWSEVEPLLKAGKIYLQDPSTRIPVELLAPKQNELALDLCAAPGGKSLLIADAMKSGKLVAIEAPTGRIDRLKENLSRIVGVEPALVQADVLQNLGVVLREHRLADEYDAVLLDVPCSNTGVMRHRVDVKWRLQAGDFKKHPQQQLSMLHSAARVVRSGGRLVYSTCSIDTAENEQVVREFLASKAGGPFNLEKSVLSFPWTSGHDGGAAFLLRKSG